MSIVVAVRKGGRVVLAADSQSNFGSQRVTPDNHQAVKIREIGGNLLAITGWGLYQNIFDSHLAGRRTLNLSDERRIYDFFQRLWRDLHQKHSLVNDQCNKDDNSPFGDLDASFMIGNRNGIFLVASDMSITRFEKYYAIGSGADYSLGALHATYESDLEAEELAGRAVRTALAFNVFCGGDVITRSVAVPAGARAPRAAAPKKTGRKKAAGRAAKKAAAKRKNPRGR